MKNDNVFKIYILITILNICICFMQINNILKINEIILSLENMQENENIVMIKEAENLFIKVYKDNLVLSENSLIKVYKDPLVLSEKELNVVAGVITSETGGYYYDNSNVMPDRILVAQTIREEVEQTGKMPSELANNIRYAKPTYEGMSEQSKTAVDLVFNKGYGIVDCGIKYYYAPKICESEFHESQNFILETKLHRYFN